MSAQVAKAANPVLFFFHMLQDMELLIPLIRRVESQGKPALALLHFEANGKYPAMAERFEREGIPWAVYDERIRWEWLRWLRNARAVVTACDCSVQAHRRGYRFVRRARLLGVPTFTTQHGLENIGLNYSDGEHPIHSVRFASRHVLTWGKKESLHPGVLKKTRRKAVPVGILKELPERKDATVEPDLVTVFENLHWGRYSEHYRESFLNSLGAAAQALPDIRFVLKPHQAGRWMTHRYKGQWKAPANVEVLNPLAPNPLSAGEWIAKSSLVFTTPSTIALDAALVGTPVAVLGFDLDLPNYAPLPIIRNARDWITTIEGVQRGDFSNTALGAFISQNAVRPQGFDEATRFILSHS